MKANKIIKVLSQFEKQTVYIQIGDNAYPAKIRVFKEQGKNIPYITIDNYDDHRNFPEPYGCKEITENYER